MTEPINVTPEEERAHIYDDPPASPSSSADWSSVNWTSVRTPSIPWLGVLLVLVGIALLIGTVFPAVHTSTLVLLGVAVAFLVAWVVGHSFVGMVFGLLALALGTAELIEDLALLGPAGQDVPGLWSASLAIAFLVIWLIGYATKRRSTWPLWAFAIFGLIGFAELSSHFANTPALDLFWPVAIIAVGVVLLISARRR